MAEDVWVEHPTLPGQKTKMPLSKFRVYAKNGWVEVEAPEGPDDRKIPGKFGGDIRPKSDKKAPKNREADRPKSDKTAATSLSERPKSDKKPATATASKRPKSDKVASVTSTVERVHKEETRLADSQAAADARLEAKANKKRPKKRSSAAKK